LKPAYRDAEPGSCSSSSLKSQIHPPPSSAPWLSSASPSPAVCCPCSCRCHKPTASRGVSSLLAAPVPFPPSGQLKSSSLEEDQDNTIMPTRLILLSCLLLPAASVASSRVTPQPKNTSGCPVSCGNISIDYPFGIGTGCFRNGFEIVCDHATGTPSLAGTTQPVPVNLLSIKTAEARVMLPVAWECFNHSKTVNASSDGDVHFNRDDVYRISNTHNHLVVVGCNTLGYTQSQRSEGNGYYSYAYYTGCMS
ncbi:unnamed protein product, partial [Urochloa humidicola]